MCAVVPEAGRAETDSRSMWSGYCGTLWRAGVPAQHTDASNTHVYFSL